MSGSSILENRIKELEAEYSRVALQLSQLKRTIDELKIYTSHIISTGDCSVSPPRMSNSEWIRRAMEMARELVKVNRKAYKNTNSVLIAIYIKLRDVYGIVLDQLRKDFRYNHNTLRYPSALEAISDDDKVRSIFDSILLEMFPDDYFEDEILNAAEQCGCAHIDLVMNPEEVITKIIEPLAIKLKDNSFSYTKTFESICDGMDCSWHNLQVRMKKKLGTDDLPTKQTIIANNSSVLRKFKRRVRDALENCKNL